ncbi:hypothetical protein ACFL1H_00230 [Nanoarchaeota archaeon]
MRKGQQEVMGLAIVVVIIIAAVGVWYGLTQYDQGSKEVEQEINRLAAYTYYAIIDTVTECKDKTVEELVEDCIDGEYIRCSGYGVPLDKSCGHVNDTISRMLDATLGKGGDSEVEGIRGRNLRYLFMLCDEPQCRDPEKGEGSIYINTIGRERCPSGNFAQSTPLIINSPSQGLKYLIMIICM